MSTVMTEMPLGAALTQEQAREIYAQGEDAVVFSLLRMAQMLAQQQAGQAGLSHETPATPSGMKPVFQKPNLSSRRKKPGRQAGHAGARRPVPERIDQTVEHRVEICPECGGPLCQCAETRTRYI